MTVVGKRIDTAIRHFSEKDYENALIQISIAIDSTAKKNWPKDKVGRRIRKFIERHETLIYKLASNGMFIVCPGSKVSFNGTLPDIFYKTLRCALLHGEELSKYIIINQGGILGVEKGKTIINPGHINGLLLSVIIDAANKYETCENDYILDLNKQAIPVRELWGNPTRLKI